MIYLILPAYIVANRVEKAILNREICYVSENDVIKNGIPESFEYKTIVVPISDRYSNIDYHFNMLGKIIFSDKNINNMTIKASATPVCSLWGLTKATVWIKYSAYVIDQEGEIVTGSKNVIVKISYYKKDGKWIVNNIEEKP